MNVRVGDIEDYLDEIVVLTFINKYSEKDIVSNFIYEFDKLNFKYTKLLDSIESSSFELDGIFEL